MSEFDEKIMKLIHKVSHNGTKVNNKVLKKINEECHLRSITGLKQTELDIKFSGASSKMKVTGAAMTVTQFKTFITDYLAVEVAKVKGGTAEEISQKIIDRISTYEDATAKAAPKAPAGSVVDRLTDTKHYTGTHQQRFDESGKGKGKEGRENVVDDSGYVGDYKNKDTYDEAHKS